MPTTKMPTTVEEIMTNNVLSVRADWPVQRLSEFFFENCISGAPVVDANDELIGVVSLTDLARFDSQPQEVDHSRAHDVYLHTLEQQFAKEELASFQLQVESQSLIRDIMTPMVFDIDVSTNIQKAADIMITGHIHRLFVTQNKKIIGVVSSLDMLKVIRELPQD